MNNPRHRILTHSDLSCAPMDEMGECIEEMHVTAKKLEQLQARLTAIVGQARPKPVFEKKPRTVEDLKKLAGEA